MARRSGLSTRLWRHAAAESASFCGTTRGTIEGRFRAFEGVSRLYDSVAQLRSKPRKSRSFFVVAPTGFDSQASLLEITFEGLALAA
jgi:hypothetical protein